MEPYIWCYFVMGAVILTRICVYTLDWKEFDYSLGAFMALAIVGILTMYLWPLMYFVKEGQHNLLYLTFYDPYSKEGRTSRT